MVSVYRWEGAIEQETERQVVIKTSRDRVVTLWERVRELHPYDVPEFLVLPIVDGNDAVPAMGGRLDGMTRIELLERLTEILDEVGRILDPGRDPDEAVREPDGRASIRRHRGVGHGGRMGNQGSTPPRLSASAIRRTRLHTRWAASSVPTSKVIIPPSSRICRFASSCCGWSGNPG